MIRLESVNVTQIITQRNCKKRPFQTIFCKQFSCLQPFFSVVWRLFCVFCFFRSELTCIFFPSRFPKHKLLQQTLGNSALWRQNSYLNFIHIKAELESFKYFAKQLFRSTFVFWLLWWLSSNWRPEFAFQRSELEETSNVLMWIYTTA